MTQYTCIFRQGQVKEQSSQRKQNLADSLLYAQFNRDVVEVCVAFVESVFRDMN